MARTKQTSRASNTRRLKHYIIPNKPASKKCSICKKTEQLATCQGQCKQVFCYECLDLESQTPTNDIYCTECHPEDYEVESISGIKLLEPREFIVKWTTYKSTSWVKETDLECAVGVVHRFIRRYNLSRPEIPMCIYQESNEVGFIKNKNEKIDINFISVLTVKEEIDNYLKSKNIELFTKIIYIIEEIE